MVYVNVRRKQDKAKVEGNFGGKNVAQNNQVWFCIVVINNNYYI